MEYTGSSYDGGVESRRFEGRGEFQFPNGTKYVGEFVDGMFHGEGTIIVPNCGEYTARWANGREVSGKYTFKDGLSYKVEGWDYCSESDRRFYTERKQGIKPVGESQLTNNRDGDPLLEEGQYDAGDGYYDSKRRDGKIRNFKTGEEVRFLEPNEESWLRKICRTGPSGTVGRDPIAALKAAFQNVALNGEVELTKSELGEAIESNAILKKILEQSAGFYSVDEMSSLFKSSPDEKLTLDAFCKLFKEK